MIKNNKLWKKASELNKSHIDDKIGQVIFISAAVSSGVSFMVSKTDWSKIIITNVEIIDFLLGVLGIALIVYLGIFFILGVFRIFQTSLDFLNLLFKTKIQKKNLIMALKELKEQD